MNVMFASKFPLLAIALLLVAAGCLGGGPLHSDQADSNDRSTPGSDAEPVDGLDRSSAEATLRSAGSFTATWRYSGTDADGTDAEISHTYYADLDGDRSLVQFSTTQDGQAEQTGWEQFYTDGKLYSRFGSGDGAFYQVQPDDATVVADAISRAGVYAYGDLDDLTATGTERYEGEPVTRYELSDSQSLFWAAGAEAGSGDDVEVLDFEYVVLVDDDGLSRYESWSYTGTTADGQTSSAGWEYSLTDVGSTSFENPDWLPEAEAQAAGFQG